MANKEPVRKMDAKLSSWFLGPSAENADIFERLVLEALRDCVFWRRNFHPKDEILITEKLRRDPSFQESIDHLQQEFIKLLADLKRDIPFYSPRYIGHMLGDQLLPAIIGYFAAMLHNPNNVTPEASPITTEYEEEVAQQLARLIGYSENKNNRYKTWGHLTSGGTIANFEAIWVARNLKYFPFGAKKTAEELNLEDVKIQSPKGDIVELTRADEWALLNLDSDEILHIRENLCKAYRKAHNVPRQNYKEVEKIIDKKLDSFTISGKGSHQFFADLDYNKVDNKVKPGVILVSATAHYSIKKVTEALGIGKNQIKMIPVDEHFRMNLEMLKETLQSCLDSKQPIIALISVLGSTEESAVDYVHEIVRIQNTFKKKGLNFYHHCDAAWGGYVRTLFFDQNGKTVEHAGQIMNITELWPSDAIFESFNSINKADSVTIDPHKLGYIPYPAGAIVFRNEKVRDLITYKAPYIFHEEEKKGERPFIGQYILEGSKPGAAAAACWLAHKVVPLNQSGYGEIIGKSIKGAQQLYLKCCKDLGAELESSGIKLRAVTDPPDINIFCFFINKKGNSSLEKMNELNKAIYNKLKFDPEEVIQRHDFIISNTDFEFEEYGQAMEEHLKQVGIADGEFEKVREVKILRCTIIDPWLALSRGGKPDFIADFASVLGKIIKSNVENLFGKYLFCWEKIQENDSEGLMEFLIQKFKLNIDWVKTAKIEKIDDNEINISEGKNSISLKLNDKKTKVNLKIDDGTTDELIVRMENSNLNVYGKI